MLFLVPLICEYAISRLPCHILLKWVIPVWIVMGDHNWHVNQNHFNSTLLLFLLFLVSFDWYDRKALLQIYVSHSLKSLLKSVNWYSVVPIPNVRISTVGMLNYKCFTELRIGFVTKFHILLRMSKFLQLNYVRLGDDTIVKVKFVDLWKFEAFVLFLI